MTASKPPFLLFICIKTGSLPPVIVIYHFIVFLIYHSYSGSVIYIQSFKPVRFHFIHENVVSVYREILVIFKLFKIFLWPLRQFKFFFIHNHGLCNSFIASLSPFSALSFIFLYSLNPIHPSKLKTSVKRSLNLIESFMELSCAALSLILSYS